MKTKSIIRANILNLVKDKDMDITQIAKELGIPYVNAIYHINLLEANNVIFKVKQQSIIKFDTRFQEV